MSKLWTAALTIAALAATAASAQAVTYSYPVLEPTQTVLSGWHPWGTTSAVTAAVNNGVMEGEAPTAGMGIEGGLNESFGFPEYTPPPGGKIIAVTYHVYANAGSEGATLEAGLADAAKWENETRAKVALTGSGAGWIAGTWTFTKEGFTDEQGHEQEGQCGGILVYYGEPPRAYICRSIQEQLNAIRLWIGNRTYSPGETVKRAYLQLEVESP